MIWRDRRPSCSDGKDIKTGVLNTSTSIFQQLYGFKSARYGGHQVGSQLEETDRYLIQRIESAFCARFYGGVEDLYGNSGG